MFKLLKDGAVFRKHASAAWGGAHRRRVWVPPSMDRIKWRPLTKKPQSQEKTIMVKEIKEITTNDRVKDRCFSIIAAAKRLDLEADSKKQRDEWVKALRHLKGSSR